MSSSVAMGHATFCITGRAMRELREAAIDSVGELGWNEALADLDPSVQTAAGEEDDDAWIDERHWVDALHAADARLADDGSLARAIGLVRAETLMQEIVQRFSEPLEFLKHGAALYFAHRANYGATHLELAPKLAIVRVLSSPHVTLEWRGRPNLTPLAVATFLETATTALAGAPQACRYAGATARADKLFDQPIYNQLFQFDLLDTV